MSQTILHESSAERRLDRIGVEAYRDVARLEVSAETPSIEVRFYPYAGMHSTVRLRGGRIFVRLSDLLEGAPEETIGALVRILIAKLLRRRVRKAWNETYRAYTARVDVVEASEGARRERGRKEMGPARGRVYDLDDLFDRLNDEYFDGEMELPRLGWTLRDGWRTHGHYDSAHHSIVLSRTLDTAATPEFVVEFILYHEMLHIAIPSELRDGRRHHHTAEFRAAESRFPRMREAVSWLENLRRPASARRKKR